MEQRPLRLGDIVDDYCPRERRLTNHAIVAIVEQTIRQTRCTTCDTEHMYKGGKSPRRKKASDEAGNDLAGGQLIVPRAAAPEVAEAAAVTPPAVAAPTPPPAPMAQVAAAPAPEPVAETPDDRDREVWPMHRPLIRATLPRVDGEPPPARPIPEFTMHQRQGRGGHGYRAGQSWQGGNGHSRNNGFRPERDGNVAPRPGGPSGGGGGGRPGRHRRNRRGGR